jgi:hypothetical protein
MSQQEIEQTINELWEMYDDAKNAGNTDLADGFANRAFLLLEKLPQNQIYLTVKQ